MCRSSPSPCSSCPESPTCNNLPGVLTIAGGLFILYLGWENFSVGAPITLGAFERRPLSAALFLGSFYFFLVGSKVLLALVTGRSRAFLGGAAYRWTMVKLGFIKVLEFDALPDRYKLNCRPHVNLTCLSCGKIVETELRIPLPADDCRRSDDFRIVDYRMECYGFCAFCSSGG